MAALALALLGLASPMLIRWHIQRTTAAHCTSLEAAPARRVAIVLGAAFTWYAVKLLQDPSTKTAMRVFTYSITYVTLLFGAMALDVLVRNG